jgi:hypothetical protein
MSQGTHAERTGGTIAVQRGARTEGKAMTPLQELLKRVVDGELRLSIIDSNGEMHELTDDDVAVQDDRLIVLVNVISP